LPDHPARAAAEAIGGEEVLDAVVHQDDLGLFQRGVAAAGAHGHADIGGREARRVVHPVAHHRDRVAGRAQRLDGGHLVLGRKPGAHLVEPELAGDRFGRVPAVTREHHRADPGAPQLGEHRAGLRADLVTQQHASHQVAPDDPDFAQLRRGRRQPARPFGQRTALEQFAAAEHQRRATDASP